MQYLSEPFVYIVLSTTFTSVAALLGLIMADQVREYRVRLAAGSAPAPRAEASIDRRIADYPAGANQDQLHKAA